ncbi:MAG TPA: hypothetical protein VK191_12860, partial [Symbiobacteriaceae bacterium]|nr:hypothetical protein [Symbiobacteriaceae bacterium]
MAKAHRLLTKEVVQGSPALKDVLEEARSGQLVISYEGETWVLQSVKDITHTFSLTELPEFKAAFAEAADHKNHLDDAEMMRLLEQELEN